MRVRLLKDLSDDSQYLLEGIKNGSAEAFELFYERYHAFVYSVAFKVLQDPLEAEDICHDIFIEISHKAESYNPKKGSVEAWLAIRTRSRSIDLLRRKQKIMTEELPEPNKAVNLNPVEEKVIQRLDHQLVLSALNQLPEAQRKAVYGSYFKEFTHRDLAARLKQPLGTVKSLVRYGIKNMRKQLVQSRTIEREGDE